MPSRRSRRLSAALASAVIAGSLAAPVASVLTAPIASAHSALVNIDPADGATVATAPTQITLTFNEEINPKFATVTLIGADKRNYASGDPQVAGATVTATVAGVTSGSYTVGYRVTSADGHVVDGSRRFTVAGGPASNTTGSPSSAAPANATETATSGGSSAMLMWGLGGLAVVLIGGAWVLIRRGH